MSPITDIAPGDDFQSELPLNRAASELLGNLFDSAWVDPAKIHQNSSRLRNLLSEAKDFIAANLGIASSELEIVGELGFGFQVALGGLLRDSQSEFIYSAVDRQVIHAFSRIHQDKAGSIRELGVDSFGIVDYSGGSGAQRVLAWQSVNRESGVRQLDPKVSPDTSLFADMSSAYPLSNLPSNWDSAIWDPRYFGGPQGIALLGIADKGKWRNPGPVIDKRRVYGSFSKPLLLATAVALEHWIKSAADDLLKLKELNTFFRNQLPLAINNVQIAGVIKNVDPRFIAFIIPGSNSEEVLRRVEVEGFLIDAGSACGSGPLSPSHVLKAMGLPEYGNYRITLKPAHSRAGIEKLISVLVKGVAAGA